MTFKLTIAPQKHKMVLDPTKQKDNECSCCGRPLNWHARSNFYVKVARGSVSTYQSFPYNICEGGELTLEPVADFIGEEPAEWAGVVGSRCAKLIPRHYKVSVKTAVKKHWAKYYE